MLSISAFSSIFALHRVGAGAEIVGDQIAHFAANALAIFISS